MIFNLLTAVLVVLKLMGLITISWFLVFLPTVIVLSVLGFLLWYGTKTD
jgi:hypothetical protein